MSRYSAEFLSQVGQWKGAPTAVDSVSIDTRTLPQGALYVALIGERLDGHDFVNAAEGAGAVMVQRPVDTALPQLVVADTLKAMQQLAHAHRLRSQARFVGVAGSNGKTTTKEMIASVLAQKGKTHRTTGNLNNHIGLPLSLLRIEDDHVFAVLETGMNHPGELLELAQILQPEIAVLTTIQAEHLEGLGTVENVAKAEGEIFAHTKRVAIVPADEPLVNSHALPNPGALRVVRFGEAATSDVRLLAFTLSDDGGTIADYQTTQGVLKVRLPHLGKHNALNAAAAVAVGLECGLTLSEIQRGLEQTPLVDRRLRIHKTGTHTVLDDCYNANPGSMGAALEVLRVLGKGKRKVAILGEMLELGEAAQHEHSQLGKLVAQNEVDVLAVFGEHAAAVVQGAGSGHAEQTFEALWAWVQPQLQKGDVILIKGSRGMKMERFVNQLVQP